MSIKLPDKTIILGLSLDNKNMGVGALGAGIITCAAMAYPELDINVLDYGKDSIKKTYKIGGRTKDVKLLNMRFSKQLYLKHNIALLLAVALFARLLPRRAWRVSVYNCNKYLRSINEADIIGAISGGDSFSDIYGLKRFYYVILPQLLILLMEKDLILLPQTLGPFQDIVPKYLARWIVRKARLVYSRDQAGITYARKLLGPQGASRKVRFCHDVGFVVEAIKPAHVNIIGLEAETEGKDLVGLNVSGLLYMGEYTFNNMYGLKYDYPGFVKELVSYLIEKKKVRVLLIPHVFGSNEHFESDEMACRKVYDSLCNKYPRWLGYLQGEYDQNEIKYVIGKCNFFIGSRMHACIAAISQSVPAVSIAYSKKFKGVMATIGMGDYVADPKVMSEKEIMALVDRAYDERGEIKKRLEQKMPEVKHMVLGLFREIWDSLHNNAPNNNNRIQY